MSDINKFSYEEALRGFVATIILYFVFGIPALFLALGCGGLWVCGGTYLKAIRRIGVPLAVFGYAVYFLGFHWSLLWILVYGIILLCQGDGFPDHRVSTWSEGCDLGIFVERFLPDDRIGGPVTKWLMVVALQLAWVPLFYR